MLIKFRKMPKFTLWYFVVKMLQFGVKKKCTSGENVQCAKLGGAMQVKNI